MGPIGGWVERDLSGDAMTGTPIAAICWQFEDGTPYYAVGTTTGLFVIDNDDRCYDITPGAGESESESVALTPPFDWQLSTFGAYLIAVNSLRGDQELVVNTFVWTGDVETPAQAAWTDDIGPAGVYAAFATPERFLVVLRGEDPTDAPPRTGVSQRYSERRLFWSSQETLDDFIASDLNTGGDFDIQTEGRLVVGTAARSESLIWSDVDLWTMNFIGGDLIYSFRNVGKQCGIVGKRAYVLLDKGAFWMGRGQFFVYDGFVRPLRCDVSDRVFGDFNESRAHTVWAVANPRYNEITWFYPAAGSQYPDRYVTFNHVENHWVFGELNRTAGVAQRFRRDVVDEVKPVWFDSAGQMYEHESGIERTAQAWAASGPVELGNGDRLMRLQGILPDERTVGNVQMRLYTAMAADALETLNGPYALNTALSVRHTTRQVRVRIEEAEASDWRFGDARLGVRAVERRGVRPGIIDTAPASIEIIPDEVTLIAAQHYTFQAIIRNAAGQVLDIEPDGWESDNAADVSVDSTGTVTAIATPSVAHITAFVLLESETLESNEATVNVVGDNTPTTLEIAPTAFDILPEATRQMTYVFRNRFGQIITGLTPTSWSSSNPDAATVDSDGLVTGVGDDGSQTTITAAYNLVAPALTSNDAIATAVDPFVTHTFDGATSNALVVTEAGDGVARALLVAGGGGGGAADGSGVMCGGGGGGGMIDTTIELTVGTFPLQIGAGGAGGIGDHTIGAAVDHGDKGQDTTGFGLTAVGGGGGMSNLGGGDIQGGSSGGVRSTTDMNPPIIQPPADLGIPGQGHAGGAGVRDSTSSGPFNYGGGGGGAGGDGESYLTGIGGPGAASDITGEVVYYAGGGGGGRGIDGGAGGIGGGGHGGKPVSGGGTGTQGEDNKGGGGGGGGGVVFAQGSRGGHGILVVRYRVASGIVASGGTKVVHS